MLSNVTCTLEILLQIPLNSLLLLSPHSRSHLLAVTTTLCKQVQFHDGGSSSIHAPAVDWALASWIQLATRILRQLVRPISATAHSRIVLFLFQRRR